MTSRSSIGAPVSPMQTGSDGLQVIHHPASGNGTLELNQPGAEVYGTEIPMSRISTDQAPAKIDRNVPGSHLTTEKC